MEERLQSSELLRKASVHRETVAVAVSIAPPAPYLARTHVDVPAAEPATDPIVSVNPTQSVVPESETTNVWPDEAAESAFLAESKQNGVPPPPTPVAAPTDAEADKPLPRLDDLVARIPEETRELLEELFRAKFTTVRRVKTADLKPS